MPKRTLKKCLNDADLPVIRSLCAQLKSAGMDGSNQTIRASQYRSIRMLMMQLYLGHEDETLAALSQQSILRLRTLYSFLAQITSAQKLSDMEKSTVNIIMSILSGMDRDCGVDQISPMEREVLKRIASGLSNKEISSYLGIGTRTVETHRERLMKKLDIHNIAGLTKLALATGLVVNEYEV